MKAQRQIGIGRISTGARARLQALGVDVDCLLIDHAGGKWGRATPWSIVQHNRRCDEFGGYGGWLEAVQISKDEILILVTNVTLDAAARRTFVYLSTEQTPDILGEGL